MQSEKLGKEFGQKGVNGVELSTGQKLQSIHKFIHFLFQVKHDISQIVETIMEEALCSATMLLDNQGFELM